MMRYLLQLLLIPTLLFAAVPHNAVAADWRVEGKGELTYPSGRKEAINFGFSYTKTGLFWYETLGAVSSYPFKPQRKP